MTRALPAFAALVLAGALLAGCGGSGSGSTTSTVAPPSVTPTSTVAAPPDPSAAMEALIKSHPSLAGTVTTLYKGSPWSVVESVGKRGANAVAFRLVRNRWRADLDKKVVIKVLGPDPGERVSPLPQIAFEFISDRRFIESALWIDGTELPQRSGGSPRDGTIYSSPSIGLTPGEHVAVGFAATSADGDAVAWMFDVPG